MSMQTIEFDLRPSAGVVLRGIVDVTCVLAASLFAWLVTVDGAYQLLVDHYAVALVLLACIGVSLATAYAVAGMYTNLRGEQLREKFRHLLLINLAVFLAVGVLWLLAAKTNVVPAGAIANLPSLIVVAFTISTALTCLARATSLVLRFDNGESADVAHLVAQQRDIADKVLVVGGGGYIGSALVEILLNEGKKVTVLDAMHFGEEPLEKVIAHPDLEIIHEDFRHVEVLTRAMNGVGSVIHLGGLVGDPACAVDPGLTIDMNVTATKVVGEIAKASGVRRFIFASSCSVYGACDDIVDETSPFNPQSLYAETKVASEAVLTPLNDDDFAVTHLRFATVYGISGRVRFDLVVNLLSAKAVRDGQITVFGPDQWRPFVHVEDVARAVAVTLNAPIELVAGDVFNVGSDEQNYTLGDAAEMINEKVPEAEILADLDFADKRNYRVSFKKIRDVLDFEPKWTLDAGIDQVIEMVRSNHVGHYSSPTYSNVLTLKETGPENLSDFNIAGWEHEYMTGSKFGGAPTGDRTHAA